MPKINNIETLKASIREHLTDYLTEMGIEIREDNHLRCPEYSKHKNDDDSFSACLYPDPEHYRCFVCENGVKDIFYAAHILEGKPIEGAGFIHDNILYLAHKYNIPYQTKKTTQEEQKRDKLAQVLDYTNKMLKAAIKSGHSTIKPITDYLKERGWDSLIDEFEFGYCVYDKLIQNLKNKGFEDFILEDAGLIPKKGKKRGVSEILFNKRLVFPIKNHYGRIVGFFGRRISKEDTGDKYLNFRDTKLYTKGAVLYNLNKARRYPYIYLVEGQGDLFTMYKYGIQNVVALCGTAFSKKQYDLLVSQGIKKITLCLDSDKPGKEAIQRIVDKELKHKTDLEVFIKELPTEFKDPDEFLKENGRNAFDKIPELPLFDWKLKQLEQNIENEFFKNDLMQLIVLEEDYTAKEKLIKKLARVLDVDRDTVSKEIDRHEKYKGKYLITSADVLAEQNSLEKELEGWESLAWSRTGELLGLAINNFSDFTHKISGIQNRFYLIAADTNIGKTALLLNFANGLLEKNENIFILFFSIDDTIEQIIPRMASLRSKIDINSIANPKFQIEKNRLLTEEEIKASLKNREETMNYLKSLSNRFAIKEQAQIRNIEEMEKLIRIYRQLAGNKQLVVMVDNIHRIQVGKKLATPREQFMYISTKLKDWKEIYKVPVIVTAELKKLHEDRKPRGDDIKEVKDLQYDSDLTMLLYTDFYLENGKEKLKFADEVSGFWKPVLQGHVIKNKTSSFKGSIYFKFHPELSKLEECKPEEINQEPKKETK